MTTSGEARYWCEECQHITSGIPRGEDRTCLRCKTEVVRVDYCIQCNLSTKVNPCPQCGGVVVVSKE